MFLRLIVRFSWLVCFCRSVWLVMVIRGWGWVEWVSSRYRLGLIFVGLFGVSMKCRFIV